MEVKVANPPLPLKVRRTQLRRTSFFCTRATQQGASNGDSFPQVILGDVCHESGAGVLPGPSSTDLTFEVTRRRPNAP